MKKTKRALLLSAIAVVMSIAMLIGSTFAWFTDSASTAVNTIQSGTLKVDLIDEAGASLKGQKIYFVNANGEKDNLLWEPGCTYNTQKFFVKNNGNLALKYEIAITGLTGDVKLLEAIEWSVTVNGVTTALSELTGFLMPNGTAGDQSGAIVLTGHMKENAGNEYQDKKIENIAITVYATQYTYESDSNDDQYDKDATVLVGHGTKEAPYMIANASQLVLISDNIKNNVAADAGNVSYASASYKLMNDIDLAGQKWTPIGTGSNPFNGTFDGNGKTISNVVLDQENTDASSLVNNDDDYGYAYGFFGVIGWQTGEHANEKVTIKNLNLDVSYETDEAYVLGGLVGADAAGHKGSGRNSSLACDIEISNITVNGKVISKNTKSGATVGGVAGKLYTKGNIVIDGCTNNAEVSASETPTGKDNKVGGILGFYSGANSAVITNNTNNGNVTSQSVREAGSKASGICITGATTASVNISNNTNNGNVTGTENAVAAIAFSGNDKPICMVPQYTTMNNSNSGKLYTLNYQTFEKTEVLYTFLVYGGKSQTPADNTTDDSKYTGGVVVMEINEIVSGQ